MQNPLELYKYLITIAYIGLTTIDENATINEKQQTNKYLKGRWYGYHTRNFNTALLIHVKRNTIRERMIEMHLLPNVYGKDVTKVNSKWPIVSKRRSNGRPRISNMFIILSGLFVVVFLCLFLAFDFCRFCVVIRFFHPHHNGQWPPTSKDFLSHILSITFIFLS